MGAVDGDAGDVLPLVEEYLVVGFYLFPVSHCFVGVVCVLISRIVLWGECMNSCILSAPVRYLRW